MKLGTIIKHDQTTCRDKQRSLHVHFCGIIPLCNFQYKNRVRSITLIPFEIISRNLAHIKSMTRRRAEIKTVTPSTFFCGIIPLCNFQYRFSLPSPHLIPPPLPRKKKSDLDSLSKITYYRAQN